VKRRIAITRLVGMAALTGGNRLHRGHRRSTMSSAVPMRRHRSRQRRLDARCEQGPPLGEGDPRRFRLVNWLPGHDPAVPFGDHKMSGYGRESGLHLDQDRVTRCSVRPTSAAGLAGSCNAINPVGYIATARN
jgi:hypothetical protein